ncbi:MAG: hypothetical protein K0S65_5575 [Labilithrix sp.]|nr:hypothetical protein [Labilithrix sp.]
MNARALLLALAFLLGSGTTQLAVAAKPDTNACIAAFDRGQRARSDKKLREAQTDLLVCTRESCPAVLRTDCAGVLRSVQAAVPTIVLAADDGEGHDVTEATVHAGTERVAEKLDGRAIEFDPGAYDFRFERPGGAIVTVHAVLREGEKNRVVRASFAAKMASASTAAPVATAPAPAAGDAARRPIVGYVLPAGLAVIGVAALAVSGVSRLSFDSQVDDMRARCAPECTQSERSDLSSTLVTANVALGVGIGAVALALGSWFLFEPGSAKRSASLTRWAW